MSAPVKLSESQRCALQIASDRHGGSKTAQELLTSPAVMAAMVRRGWFDSSGNSERVRGERRVHWREYRITEAGRRALEAG